MSLAIKVGVVLIALCIAVSFAIYEIQTDLWAYIGLFIYNVTATYIFTSVIAHLSLKRHKEAN